MREPKPFVVGISWVVECAEKCRRVGEENFLVDLEGVNVAGNNKVSVMHRHIRVPGFRPDILTPNSGGVRCFLNTSHGVYSLRRWHPHPVLVLHYLVCWQVTSRWMGLQVRQLFSLARQLIILLYHFVSIVGGDRSMNSSDGPVEDDLPPLERARQRSNIFFKP
jgi:hypothetical protein